MLYVDSPMRSEGTDCSFKNRSPGELALGLTWHETRQDPIYELFPTTYIGKHLCYKDGSGGLQHYSIPEQAYTGVQLAAAIELRLR